MQIVSNELLTLAADGLPARTSETHPIRIPQIHTSLGGSVIPTFCPGKKQAAPMTGAPWQRDLWTDLNLIESSPDHKVSVVVTLLEQQELEDLGVPELGYEVNVRGWKWYHLPFANDTIPNGNVMQKWNIALPKLVQKLSQDRDVLIHCMGGIGRTSIMSALLLYETGMDMDKAIDKLKEVRPGSFLLAKQEEFCHDYARLNPRRDVRLR